ncbi:selenium-dependent molybdenum hydroxylase system protein, YqeB family [Caloramator fervidus]|uniref:Selenium-dependent molybdenum hydroxylase system protein, YqeB family n=2 Tax=Caloramator fervidus TaxID=29344 RepID=A0A1H5XW53_9CLOT|nr:selenium-dependent molybdenum hydroxylase system protein, YqeB family [Caloramator fervidus]
MVSIVILASGFSKRMNENKLLLEYKGLPLIEWVIRNAKNSKADEVLIVYKDDEVKKIAERYSVKPIYNINPEYGQSQSIKLGFENVNVKDGVMFLPGDMPLFSCDYINNLIDEYEKNKEITVPFILNTIKAPCIFPYIYKDEFLDLKGDIGGKVIIKRFEEKLNRVYFKDIKIFYDVDYKEDIKRLDKKLVLIKGAGEIASGVALRLKRCGFDIIMTEIEKPSTIRRKVAFASCIYEKECSVEGVFAKYVKRIEDIERVLKDDKIPVIVDESLKILDYLNVDVLIDATLSKKNLGTKIDMAPITIGLGPGFEAGVDVKAVVETNRGHFLGRVYYTGKAQENTGVPGEILGYTIERVLKAPKDGKVKLIKDIGDVVKKGDLILMVDDVKVEAKIDGVIRGLIKDGYFVHEGMKIGDIDPRGNVDYCFKVSEKALAIAGGVLEAILGGF